MQQFYVQLSSINDVKQFVSSASMQPCEIDVVSGRYTIDAKSIMGLFSLDLGKPILVEVHGTPEQAQAFAESVEQLTVDN